MKIMTPQGLRKLAAKYAEARPALNDWSTLIEDKSYPNFHAVKKVFGTADNLGDGLTIFNIKGNKFRLIVHIAYNWQRLFVLWFGTHAEYDKLSTEQIKNLRHEKH